MGKASPHITQKNVFSLDNLTNVKANYPLRVMCCLFVFALHISLFWGDESISIALWAVLLLHGFVYPHVSYYFSTTSEHELRNLQIDSFCYAFCCAIWGGNFFLIALIFSAINMSILSAGGRSLIYLKVFVFK